MSDERILAPVEQQLIEKLDRLDQRASQLLQATAQQAGSYPSQVSGNAATPHAEQRAWFTQALVFLENTLGDSHRYVVEFREECSSNMYGHVESGKAILETVRDDLSEGMLRSLKSLVAAEVFTDFVGMAQHLLDTGYKDPAASLTGAVFEDGLRRIAESNNVAVQNQDSIGSLNNRLAQAGVYNRMRQQQLQSWNTLRNNADHGYFNEYASEDVQNMINDVRSLLAEHL